MCQSCLRGMEIINNFRGCVTLKGLLWVSAFNFKIRLFLRECLQTSGIFYTSKEKGNKLSGP